MKKIFVLLFSMWVPIYVVIGLVASTENSAIEDEVIIKEAPRSQIVDREEPNTEIEVNASFHYSGVNYLY